MKVNSLISHRISNILLKNDNGVCLLENIVLPIHNILGDPTVCGVLSATFELKSRRSKQI